MPTTESSKDSSNKSETGSMHESNAKYSVIYHSGLEVVDQDNAPEVVSSTTDLKRKSSLMSPEPNHVAPYYSDKKGRQSFYEPPQALTPEHEGMQYYGPQDGKEATSEAVEVESNKDRRRCCGIPRRFFIILVVVVLIVIIGAVLGGVLGTLLAKKQSATSNLQTMSGTGLASTLDGDGSGRLLTYFQDPNGRILENSYIDGTWTLENEANIDLSVVTTQAAYGSQLAAISYQYDSKIYRQIFFITSTGAIMTANSTETTAGIATNWSVARSITNDIVDPNGLGLTACWSNLLMNGIRAFYPSQYGYIQEVKFTFGEDSWQDGNQIPNSDPKSGIGCAIKNDATDQYLNLYYRNTASGQVKQAYIDYAAQDPSWLYHSTLL